MYNTANKWHLFCVIAILLKTATYFLHIMKMFENILDPRWVSIQKFYSGIVTLYYSNTQNITQVKVEIRQPNDYLRKSNKVLRIKSTQV